MESPGGMSDGGVSIQPWQVPKLGGGISSSGRGIGQMAGGAGTGTSQGLGSTGISAGFAEWPGHMEPAWQHRGFFGGTGTRTGGYA